MTESQTPVPEGHEVRVFRGSIDPLIARLAGGLLVANTGLGGDNQVAEITSLLDALAAEIKPAAVRMNVEAARVDELFGPDAPAPRELDSAALVYLQKGSLVGWTDDALQEVAAKLHDLGRRTKLFVFLDDAPDLTRLAPLLVDGHLDVRRPAADGTVVAEVRSPDGATTTGLVGEPVTAAPAPSAVDEAAAPPARSPRLASLVLTYLEEPTAESKRALDDYLRARTAPLALIATRSPSGSFGIQPRSWPDKTGFVAYGDERSLHRSARELGMAVGSYAIAAMSPAKLFAWAVSLQMPIMLCAFDDRPGGTGTAWHVALEVEDLRRLTSAS